VSRVLNVALLVSGEGTTLEAIAELASGGHLPVHIALVVADRPHALAIEKARRRGLATAVLPSRGTPAEVWAERLTQELRERGVELVVNAGFLTILPPAWVAAWRGRAINLHPSLLPRHGGMGFYGPRVHEAVLAAGDRQTGATIHLVTDDVDRGPTIAQQRLDVLPGDTPESLRQRLHPVEVELLAATLRRFADGSLPLPYPAEEPHGPERRRSPGERR
jgi:phosphoribosylglycinamide formyltransferase 1